MTGMAAALRTGYTILRCLSSHIKTTRNEKSEPSYVDWDSSFELVVGAPTGSVGAGRVKWRANYGFRRNTSGLRQITPQFELLSVRYQKKETSLQAGRFLFCSGGPDVESKEEISVTATKRHQRHPPPRSVANA